LAEQVANTAADQDLSPMGNVHGSADYQKHLARVLTRRALATAFERARA
jgi:carbon-monoxide dehydrogenase medium subunit